MPDDVEYRSRYSLNPGSRVTTIIATALVAVGVYNLFTPTHFQSANGNIDCGSAALGAPSKFASNICNGSQHHELALAILFFALAVIVGVLGLILYGLERTIETRPVRDHDYDDEDDRPVRRPRRDEDDERPARPARRRYDDED